MLCNFHRIHFFRINEANIIDKLIYSPLRQSLYCSTSLLKYPYNFISKSRTEKWKYSIN